MQQPPKLLVRDLRPNMPHQFTIEVIVVKEETRFNTKDGSQVAHFRVADKTGSITLVMFGDKSKFVKPVDILRIKNAYTDIHKFRMCLYGVVWKNFVFWFQMCYLI